MAPAQSKLQRPLRPLSPTSWRGAAGAGLVLLCAAQRSGQQHVRRSPVGGVVAGGTHQLHTCWPDLWVARECCDTKTYGTGGMPLCFGGAADFARCCQQLENPRTDEEVRSGNRSTEAGEATFMPSGFNFFFDKCESRMDALIPELASQLMTTVSYNDRNGAHLGDSQAHRQQNEESAAERDPGETHAQVGHFAVKSAS